VIVVHAVAVVAVVAGGIAIYLIGFKAHPAEGERTSKWVGWLALYVLGVIVSLFMVAGAVVAFFGAVAILVQLGLRPEPGWELEMLWFFLAAPIYWIAFLVGAHSRDGKRPNNAIDSDTVRAPLRSPHGARHRER
jgi:hypothetical protein